jgi:hypothetical protein
MPAAAAAAAFTLQGILHDGMKVLQVTGPDGCADTHPIITTENLGELLISASSGWYAVLTPEQLE